MTDNEIIKALECCSKDDIDCEKCSAKQYCDKSTDHPPDKGGAE